MTRRKLTKGYTLRIRILLWLGVLRRFALYVFNRQYVNRSIAARKGECKRCGICCHLVAKKCGMLAIGKNGTRCRIYTLGRLPNCWIFPIDAHDIRDRNLIAPPDVPCGYYF
ncbi:hypothetical protein ACYULU_02560 [Breznakiellaceae bacterium SP9]